MRCARRRRCFTLGFPRSHSHGHVPISEAAAFYFHRARHELGNYAALRLQHCDGAIVSMHQSGTHWLKYMLASAIATHYAIEPPRYNHANDVIGGLKDARADPRIPDLRSTHSIAPLLLPLLLAGGLVRLPPLVVLVRDMRRSLVSNYRKWAARYATDFSGFLRGDPSGRRFNSDIWWCIRFHNAWGRLIEAHPRTVRLVRYEDLEAEPQRVLAQIAAHLGLPLSAEALAAGVTAASKSAMLARADPGRPRGEVNLGTGDPYACYAESDREFLRRCCARYLRYTFAYDFESWAA